MAKKVRDCETPECENKATCGRLCTACYSWAYYHKQQGVAANLRYRKKQRRIAARIEQHMPDRKVTKTVARSRQTEARAYLN